MSGNLQDQPNHDFENFKRSLVPEETRSLREVLLDHDNDFPDRRHLDDADQLLADSFGALRYVVCSALNVYNYN